MKKMLLLSAVAFGILGISAISYAECHDKGDWACFHLLPDLTYDKLPNASCMEMICRQGCVENIKTGDGDCCPVPTEGTNCLDEEYNEKGCLIKKKLPCPADKPVCQSDGTCGCPEGVDSYTKMDGTTGCCPTETPKWDATNQICQKSDDDISEELCWTSANMYCKSILGMTFEGISMEDMLKHDCVKNECYIGPDPQTSQKPYLKARVKFEYLTPETEGVVKKISLGTGLNGASEIATLTQPSTWNPWKEIAMFQRCTSAKKPKQVWLAGPHIKEAYNNACTQKGNNNYSNISFNLKFCVEYKYFGHMENECTAKRD